MSVPIEFIISTMWAPLVKPDRSEGENRSPPKVVMVWGDAARSRSSRVMSGAKAAGSAPGLDLADVVDVEEGDCRRFGRRRGRDQEQQGGEEARRQHTGHVHGNSEMHSN